MWAWKDEDHITCLISPSGTNSEHQNLLVAGEEACSGQSVPGLGRLEEKEKVMEWVTWVTGAETKTIYGGLWGLCVSFSLAASGWLHLWLQGSKNDEEQNLPLLLSPGSCSLSECQLQGHPATPPHFSANNISTFMLCSITTVPFPKPPEGISRVSKACAL